MKRKTVQIVITRQGADAFKVSTFDDKECVGGELFSASEVIEFVAAALPRLRALGEKP